MGRKTNFVKQFLKLAVFAICTAGFLFQTIEFMYLYWTYPTVVDIQVSIPSEIDLPGVSLCNANGIIPESVCTLKGTCAAAYMLKYVRICDVYPILCNEKGQMPEDFRAVTYNRFMQANQLNSSSLQLLRKPLNDFLKCKISYDGLERNCSIDDAIYGSYYSESFMPHFCFTINTLWSQPHKKIEKIKKSERIKMEFFMDIADRLKDPPMDEIQNPKYNYPSSPAVQLAVHSPFTSPSPYLAGQTFFGGKRYEVKLKQDEKHLLPAPYQTNCTDYMPSWYSRGGIGPLNQLMVIQECKLNASLEKLGCVPISIDYPHNETLCKLCNGTICNDTIGIWDHCTGLLQTYNQPCSFIAYDMEVEEKVVYIEKTYTSSFIRYAEKAVFQEMGYNCTFERVKTRRCQTVNIEFVFDNFEITNITYNPKFESLELFSVIGGYMGMYLGISIVAMYDFAELILISMYKFVKKRNDRKKQKAHAVKPFKKKLVDPYDNIREFRKRTAVYSYRDRY